MNTIKEISSIIRCVDCGEQNLTYNDNKMSCNKCKRDYSIIDNILSMMPSHILDLKRDEITKRDADEQTYDSKRPQDYIFLIDQYSIEKNRDKLKSNSIVLDLACGTGRTSILLAKYVNTVVSIDFSV